MFKATRQLVRGYSQNSQSFYEILQCPPNATPGQIKSKYFQLCKQLHPDSTAKTADSDRFLRLTDAYNCLKDAKKRQEYDKSIAIATVSKERNFNSQQWSFKAQQQQQAKQQQPASTRTHSIWSKLETFEGRKEQAKQQSKSRQEQLDEAAKVQLNRILVVGGVVLGYFVGVWLSE